MNKFEKEHYAQLIGRKIVGLVETDDVPPVPGFTLDDGKTVFILCDPEGNGPGFLAIEKGGG